MGTKVSTQVIVDADSGKTRLSVDIRTIQPGLAGYRFGRFTDQQAPPQKKHQIRY